MSLESPCFLASGRVPQLDGVVRTAGGGQAPAVGAMRDTGAPPKVASKNQQLLAVAPRPHPDGGVLTATGDPIAVGTEDHTGNRPLVPSKSQPRLAAGDLPHPDGLVRAGP